MSALMQLVEPLAPQVSLSEGPVTKSDVLLFELPPEQRLKQALEQLVLLQGENASLRMELLRSAREIQQRNVLLRNARVRERTLRAQLAATLH